MINGHVNLIYTLVTSKLKQNEENRLSKIFAINLLNILNSTYYDKLNQFNDDDHV